MRLHCLVHKDEGSSQHTQRNAVAVNTPYCAVDRPDGGPAEATAVAAHHNRPFEHGIEFLEFLALLMLLPFYFRFLEGHLQQICKKYHRHRQSLLGFVPLSLEYL